MHLKITLLWCLIHNGYTKWTSVTSQTFWRCRVALYIGTWHFDMGLPDCQSWRPEDDLSTSSLLRNYVYTHIDSVYLIRFLCRWSELNKYKILSKKKKVYDTFPKMLYLWLTVTTKLSKCTHILCFQCSHPWVIKFHWYIRADCYNREVFNVVTGISFWKIISKRTSS